MALPLLSLMRHASRAAADGVLLEQFAAHRDQDAFAELVRRYGPEVYRTCRQLVGTADADDAFQATFLVLAARPRAAAATGSVAGWLIGVARRVSCQVRRSVRRRSRHEAAAAGRRPPAAPAAEPTDRDGVLAEEIARLPDALRAALVECLLRERPQDQVAADLGCTPRTLRRRLERARDLLRGRLVRRGVAPAVAIAMAGGGGRAAPLPAGLAERTVAVALDFLAGTEARPAALAKGAVKAMMAQTVYRWVAAAAVAFVAVGIGLGGASAPPARPEQSDAPKPKAHLQPFFEPGAGSVSGPTPGAIRAVAAEAEFLRSELTALWFGPDKRPGREWKVAALGAREGNPVMPPNADDIRVMYWTGGAEGSATQLEFGGGKMTRAWVDLSGALEPVIDDQLPQEMTRVVFAEQLGAALPWWANEGLPLLATSPRRQARADARCREGLNQGRGIRLRALFALAEAPRDAEVATAQAHSVGRFLLVRPDAGGEYRGRAAIGDLLRLGAKDGWDKAVKEVYGLRDVPALEAAWIEWMKSRKSDLRPAAPPGGRFESLPPAPPTIPPVKTNGGQ
ncbi:ECF RNA polymerase sigma factor SigE [Gemmata obscuriglobus]